MTLLTAFVNLVKTSTSSCTGRRYFKDSDVIYFFYSNAFNARRNGRPDAVGSVRDIAYMQRGLVDAKTLKQMCMLFLDHAPRSTINYAIRSIFQCFGIRLRNLPSENKDYLDLLGNKDAAQEIVRKRTRIDEVYRAALIVLLANREPIPQIHEYLYSHADESIWILAIHSQSIFIFMSNAPAAVRENEKIMRTATQYRNIVS